MYVLVVSCVFLGVFYYGLNGDLVSDVSKAKFFSSWGSANAFGKKLIRTTPSLEWFEMEYVHTMNNKGD